MKVSRRGFFQAVSVTAGAAAAGGATPTTLGQAGRDLARWATPEEQWTATVCQQCPGGCGILVRTMDGAPVGLRGNPAHPVNRGGVCAKAFGALQAVAAPERLTGPGVREGERGSGRFRPITWDEALSTLAGRLSELRQAGQAHTVLVLGGQFRGIRDTLWQRFARAYGTPNYVRVRCLQPERPALAHQLMHGVRSPLAWDLEHASFVLAFGVGLVDSWLGTVPGSRALAALREGRTRPRGVLVTVDPRRSLTAAASDRWVPIRPGTDGVLALGLAHVLLREGLHDRAFVAAHAEGFEDWTDPAGRRHRGLRTVVLEDYPPATVAETTGVPVETITAVARDLGRLRPAVVVGERGPAYGPGDLETRMAIHALNVLVGAIGVPGGLVMPGELPLAPLPELVLDQAAQRGGRMARLDGAGEGAYRFASDAPQTLAGRLEAGQPYPVNLLVLVGTNPVASLPGGAELAKAMGRIPYVVSLNPVVDESSRLADLVLPDAHFLERWQDDPVLHLAGGPVWSVGRPAATPARDVRSVGDVVLQLGRRVGGPVGESLAWDKYEDVLFDTAKGLYEVERGHVLGTREEEWVRRVQERQGYWTPEFESYDDFWGAVVQRGGWWDPGAARPSRRAAMPAGKVRLYAAGARGQVLAVPAPSRAVGAGAAGGAPFILATYRLATRPVGGGRDQPWLMESPSAQVALRWESWVEVHRDDARGLGVRDGDRVWVESPRGRLVVRAVLTDGTVRGVVHMPCHGVGDANPTALLLPAEDATRGLGLFSGTRVRIGRA